MNWRSHITGHVYLAIALAVPAGGLVACGSGLQPVDQAAVDRLYADYDREFLGYLANAVQSVGRETIKVEPLVGRHATPKLMTVKGTPYDIGATIGHIARQFGRTPPLRTDANRDLNERVAAMYQRIYPQHLEFVRGLASAYPIPADQVDLTRLDFEFLVFLGYDLLKYDDFLRLTDFSTYGDVGPSGGCSVASYYRNGRHLVGRNFDPESDKPHYFATSEVVGSYKVKGHVIYIPYLVVDGINEKGLSLNVATNGEEYYAKEPYPSEPAVYVDYLGRIVMDTCATVDEAIALIGSVRVWTAWAGVHWLIADASGKSVVVEWDLNHKMVVFDKPGPYEIVTNIALQKGEDYVVDHCWRYRLGKSLLAKASVDSPEAMAEIMTRIQQTEGDSRTLWTSIMDLNARSFIVFYRKEPGRRYELAF
jgi:Linear amide C-N hydrolases, choloylglycine hydrolase family